MLTIHDLLTDERYKKFFCKVPELPAGVSSTPWRLAVQKDAHGPWMSKDYEEYKDAFLKLKTHLTRINDAAIISKATPFEPPNRIVRVKGQFFERRGQKIPVTRMVSWKPIMPMGEEELHHWCPYCRRPTVFKPFIVHPILTRRRLNGMAIDPDVDRCSICGTSSRLVDLRK